MKQSKNTSSFYPALTLIIFFILIIASLIFNTLISKEDILTGGAVSTPAEEGNVAYANASKSDDSGFWQGYFGEITVDASASTPSSTARRGNVTERNLVLPCLGNEIYASAQNEISFENIGAGTKEAVDTFLNLNSSHLESGSKVFTTTRDFVVSSSSITNIPATFMKVSGSSDSPFAVGVLNQSNILVFLSNVSLDTVGFDSNTHDYQMMVPVNQSELTYYFFSDCEAAAPAPTPALTIPSGPSKAGKIIFPPEEEEKVIAIEIIGKEGKLIAPGYPIAVTVLKGQKKTTTIEVSNIGEGEVTNVYLFITGLPLDVFTITPEKYDLLSPNEKQAFLIEFQGNLEAGTYDIQAVIVSDQGSSFIEGVLIVKELPPEPKLPLAGAATGLVSQYGKMLLLFMLLLISLLVGAALWHLLAKRLLKTKIRKKRRA